MNTQIKTIIVTFLVTLALVGFCFLAENQLDKERIKYANRGAQAIRNYIYDEALARGSVRIDAVKEVELKEGEERKEGEEIETEIKSILLYPIINQE